MMKPRLPEILRRYRSEHKISQQKLAEMLNTVQSYISKIEQGLRHSKSSDIDFLQRVSDRLGIDPEELGLRRDGPTAPIDSVSRETLEAWEGVVELAESARSRGDPEAAVKYLNPVVSTLEHRYELKPEELVPTDLLVRSKLVLGTALGDCVPSNGLSEALNQLETARDYLHWDDPELRLQILRAYGNELRKSGDIRSALPVLQEAKALLPTRTVNGSLAIAIARAEAEVDNWPEFQHSIDDARRALDRQATPLPLFNELVVHEVSLRGLLGQGDFKKVEAELASSVCIPLNVAPQWRVIYAITVAEALLTTGDVTGGARAVREALAVARQSALPQQIKRVHDVLRRFRKLSGELADVFDETRKAMSEPRRSGR